jgi:hypothetical protein
MKPALAKMVTGTTEDKGKMATSARPRSRPEMSLFLKHMILVPRLHVPGARGIELVEGITLPCGLNMMEQTSFLRETDHRE